MSNTLDKQVCPCGRVYLNPTPQNLKLLNCIFMFFHKNLLVVAIFMNVSKKINFLLTTKKHLCFFVFTLATTKQKPEGESEVELGVIIPLLQIELLHLDKLKPSVVRLVS